LFVPRSRYSHHLWRHGPTASARCAPISPQSRWAGVSLSAAISSLSRCCL